MPQQMTTAVPLWIAQGDAQTHADRRRSARRPIHGFRRLCDVGSVLIGEDQSNPSPSRRRRRFPPGSRRSPRRWTRSPPPFPSFHRPMRAAARLLPNPIPNTPRCGYQTESHTRADSPWRSPPRCPAFHPRRRAASRSPRLPNTRRRRSRPGSRKRSLCSRRSQWPFPSFHRPMRAAARRPDPPCPAAARSHRTHDGAGRGDDRAGVVVAGCDRRGSALRSVYRRGRSESAGQTDRLPNKRRRHFPL